MFDNWIYFPFAHWVKKTEGKTWIPKGMIDADTWGQQMRKKGAEVLKTIKQKEEEAFNVLSRIT